MLRIRQYKRVATIGKLDSYANRRALPDPVLVTDSQEIDHVFSNLGYHPRNIDGLFVFVGDGDYLQIWGFRGCVAYNDKPIYRIL
jgi:hypothetical protein